MIIKKKKKRKTVVLRKRQEETPLRIVRAPTLDDMIRAGFSQSGRPVEMYGQKRILHMFKAWRSTSNPGERARIEGQIALGGWFLPPPSMEEIMEKYQPREREEDPPPKRKMIRKRKK